MLFRSETVHAHAKDFGRYPPILGTQKFRNAVGAWLCRRFGVPTSAIDAEAQILPLNGSREGLFHAVFTLVPETKGGGKPIVLIPNPFYVTYPAAVIAAATAIARTRSAANRIPIRKHCKKPSKRKPLPRKSRTSSPSSATPGRPAKRSSRKRRTT